MSFDWASAEQAITAWVTAAVGPTVPVLWAYQSRTRALTYPAVILHHGKLKPLHQEDVILEALPDSPEPPFDGEIKVTARQWWELSLQVHVLCDQDNAMGGQSPMAILGRVLTRIRRDDTDEALTAVGLGLESLGEINGDPEINSPDWRPAAMAEVKFHLAETSESAEGYIAEAVVSGELDGQDHSATLDLTEA